MNFGAPERFDCNTYSCKAVILSGMKYSVSMEIKICHEMEEFTMVEKRNIYK